MAAKTLVLADLAPSPPPENEETILREWWESWDKQKLHSTKKTNSHTGIYFLLTTEHNQAPEGDLISTHHIIFVNEMKVNDTLQNVLSHLWSQMQIFFSLLYPFPNTWNSGVL